jgi:tight adherence protein B
MEFELLAMTLLAAACIGGVAYVLLNPTLSGEKKAEKRQQALVDKSGAKRVADRTAEINNRRKQVAETLKELEQKQKKQNNISLEARLAQAGLDWGKKEFYILSGVCGLIGAGLMFAASFDPLFAAAGAIIGFAGLPRWIIQFLRDRRISRFVTELPNALDVIVRGIKSGLPVADCFRIIATEAAEPVRSEFRQIVEAQQLGMSIGEACGKLFERVPISEANFFAIVIQIQQKSGGNLSEALGNLSRVLRERRKMKQKISAMSMEAKASAAIIGALPIIVMFLVYVSSPNYIMLLWTTTAGLIGMAAGGFWMLIGIAVMKKMITFDI